MLNNNDDDVQSVELVNLPEDAKEGDSSLVKPNIGLIGHIKTNVEVQVGTAEVSVEQLFSLRKGEVLKLKEKVNSEVLVKVNSRVVAKGELVVVGDQFGVSITEVVES